MNEDNKTIAANICREHAKNYGGPSTPAMTVSAIVSELDKRDSELVALKCELEKTRHALHETSKNTIRKLEEQLGEAEKALQAQERLSNTSVTHGGYDQIREVAEKLRLRFLSSLRTPSDGQEKGS